MQTLPPPIESRLQRMAPMNAEKPDESLESGLDMTLQTPLPQFITEWYHRCG